MPQLRDGSPAHVGTRVIGKPGALPLGGFGQGAMMVGIRNEWGRAEDFGPLEQSFITARRVADVRVHPAEVR